MRENVVRAKLKLGESVYGMMVTEFDSPAIPVILADAGLDFFILDMEHGAYTLKSALSILQTARLANITPLVRVPDGMYHVIAPVLDAGAQGIVAGLGAACRRPIAVGPACQQGAAQRVGRERPGSRTRGHRGHHDHFGRPDVTRGISQPGFRTLIEFGRSGNAVIKLSGPFRSSREGYPYRDVDPFIAAAIEAFTLDRCVWGSDWPFVRMDERMDYGPPFTCLARWLPDAKDRQKVLWDSPARLFGFK